jgi:hypothetical protein
MLQRAADGSILRSVQPARTMRYRIEGSGATSQVLLVRVTPRVRLVRAAEPGVLAGTVRPRVPGTLVHVERQRGATWVHVGETIADGSGAFRLAVDLVPGTYRARVSPIAGFAEGLSPVLTVEG